VWHHLVTLLGGAVVARRVGAHAARRALATHSVIMMSLADDLETKADGATWYR
jgi:hypothetical protein